MDWNTTVAAVIAISAFVGAALSLWNFFQSPSKKNADDLAAFKSSVGSDLSALRASISNDLTKLGERLGSELKQLDEDTGDARARVSTLETIVKQMPDKDSVHHLAIALEQLNTKIVGMAASADATERTARRVEQFLLDQAKP